LLEKYRVKKKIKELIEMKLMLKKSLVKTIEVFPNWEVQELILEDSELIETLRQYLPNIMEGILDPDIAGKKPDGFLNALQSGRLGDFSQRYILTAYDNNKVIGLLVGLPEGNENLHIYSMGVLRDYRNMGVGSTLLAKCINDMIKRNINEVVLDVHSDNIPAYNLYKKLGFL
jgi:ribosomal protein S18 acetylase RimI-like enzyme